MAVDEVHPQRERIGQIGFDPAGGQIGSVLEARSAPRQERKRNPRKKPGGAKAVGRKVGHDPVEPGLAEGHRREGGPYLVADHDRIAVLALGVPRYNQAAKPVVVLGTFSDRGTLGDEGFGLTPVVHQPAPRNEATKGIVEERSLGRGVDIALVGLAGVVGVLPLIAAKLAKEGGRHVPALHGRIQRLHIGRNAGHVVHDAIADPIPQTASIVNLRSGCLPQTQPDQSSQCDVPRPHLHYNPA